MQIQLDLPRLVNRVADDFQRTEKYVVTSAARHALIEPALPHAPAVRHELSEGRITISFLQSCVFQVLELARTFVQPSERRIIDKPEVEASMQRYCPYVFWC